MNLWISSILSSRKEKPLPILSFPGIQLIHSSVNDVVKNGSIQARCMKALADRYSSLASVSNMDLSVEAEAFGSKVVFSEDEVPSVVGHIVETLEDARNLKVPPVGAGRTGEYVRAIGEALEQIQDRPVLAGVIGPFSLAGRLMEMTEIMVKCLIEPDVVHLTLAKAAEFLLNYIAEFKRIGAHGVIMAEPAAGLLSPELCAEFSSAYIKPIVEAVQDEQFIFVYHNCGNTVPLIDSIVTTGARAFHFGNAIRLKDVADRIPPDRLLMGNLDPATLFRNGTPELIRTAVVRLWEEMGAYRNFVISSGCDIPPLTPLENVDAFFEAVRTVYCVSNRI